MPRQFSRRSARKDKKGFSLLLLVVAAPFIKFSFDIYFLLLHFLIPSFHHNHLKKNKISFYRTVFLQLMVVFLFICFDLGKCIKLKYMIIFSNFVYYNENWSINFSLHFPRELKCKFSLFQNSLYIMLRMTACLQRIKNSFSTLWFLYKGVEFDTLEYLCLALFILLMFRGILNVFKL